MKTCAKKNSILKLASLALGLAAVTTQAANSFGNLPLYFEASSPARFLAQGRDAQFSVAATGAQLVLQKSGATRTVQIQFTGANPQSQIQGDGGLGRKTYC